MNVCSTEVVRALESARFNANTESVLQEGVMDLLELNFPGEFVRELSAYGRVMRGEPLTENAQAILPEGGLFS